MKEIPGFEGTNDRLKKLRIREWDFDMIYHCVVCAEPDWVTGEEPVY